jgi:hypothetical protein
MIIKRNLKLKILYLVISRSNFLVLSGPDIFQDYSIRKLVVVTVKKT